MTTLNGFNNILCSFKLDLISILLSHLNHSLDHNSNFDRILPQLNHMDKMQNYYLMLKQLKIGIMSKFNIRFTE